MKNIWILVVEVIVAGALVALGLSGKRFLFIEGARTATIVLGVVGMALCTIGVGKFITLAPLHPLSILGYVLGAVALLALLTQIFNWDIIIIGNANTALIVLAAAMVLKSVIGRFVYVLPQ